MPQLRLPLRYIINLCLTVLFVMAGLPALVQVVPAAAQAPQQAAAISALSFTADFPDAVIGHPYTQTFRAFGGQGGYTFTPAGAAIPGMVWIKSGDGMVLSGVPIAPGDYPVRLIVTDAQGQRVIQDANLHVSPHPTDKMAVPVSVTEAVKITDAPSASTPLTITASINVPTSVNVGAPYPPVSFSATGGTGQIYLSAAGSFPAGLTMTATSENNGAVTTFQLSGTPTVAGSFTFNLVATDAAGTVVSKQYTIFVSMPQYTLTPGSFSIATSGQPYSQSFSIVGNPAGYKLTMTNAAGLPAGLTYTASGETVTISGTPANVPAFSDCGPFSFNLTDQYGNVETLGPIALFLEPAPLATFTGSITPAAPLYTDQITLTLAGTGNSSATPTGILSLSLDGGAAKNYPLANGTVVLPLGRLVPGSHTLDYTYSGDSQYPATDQTYTFTVAYPAYYLTGTVSGVLQSAGYYDAIDPSDNIYIADTNVNTIRKYDPSGNLTVVPTTGLNQPRAMVFDGVGNLYISDSANNRIVVLSPNGTQTVLPGLTVNFPTGIAFDRTYQNLWIADQNNDQVVEYNMSSQTVNSTVTGFYNVPDAVAVAANGIVYVGTVGNYANGGIYSFAPGATTAAELSYPQLRGVGCLVFDKFGNLYVSDRNGNNLFRVDSSGNMTQLATQVSNAGIALDSQSNIWLANGGLSKFVPGPAGYAGVSNSYEGAYGATFGGVFRAFFHSPAGTTLAGLGVPANNAYQAPNGVTASDSFAFSDLARGPIYPGLQTGSVTATFSDGTVLKVPLYGSAYNTQLAISPGIVSQMTTNATSYGGATTDANGNVYFSDTSANKVYEVFQGIVTPIGFTGLNAPTQVAVDGNGSVYVLDSGTSRILKYNNTLTQANNTTTVAFDLSTQSALASLTAFALDGATDLYLAGANNNGQGNSYGNGRIQELNALGTYSTFSAGLVAVPTALAFDSNSQLYSGDATGLLTKFTKVGALGALAKGLGPITSMAIEPSGTVYMTTNGSAALSVVSPQGAVSSYSIAGVTNAVVMTEDKPGTLTVADGASGLLVTDVRDPSLLSPNANSRVDVGFNFPATVVGSSSPVQTYTLSNIGTTEDAYGNSGLTLQGLPGLRDFPQDPSTTCVAGATNLVAGANCVLAFTFSPTTPGNDNETDYIQYSTPHSSSGYSLLAPTFTGTAFPANVPGAPIIGIATAGNAAASVTFSAPGSNGGSAITSYTVTSSPGGITATSAVSPITVTGLTNGTAYTFAVTATNPNGTGPASARSNTVTPAAPISNVVVMHKSAPLSVFTTTSSSTSTGSPGGGIGAAIDSSGSILSIDTPGNSLTKFTDDGVFLGSLSGGGLNNATALAVDGNSNVWVANGDGTLSVFNSSGNPVSSLPVAAAGNMSHPVSVNIDAAGSVWVANTGNNTVTEIVGAAAPSPVLVNAVINATPGTKP